MISAVFQKLLIRTHLHKTKLNLIIKTKTLMRKKFLNSQHTEKSRRYGKVLLNIHKVELKLH